MRTSSCSTEHAGHNCSSDEDGEEDSEARRKSITRMNKSVSLQLFRRHIYRRPDGSLDASGVISPSCYEEWLNRKQAQACDVQARRYHRILNNHVTGVDKRTPFSREEEAAILAVLRQKQPWPCFPKHLADISKRYRARGYHEKLRAAQGPETVSTTARAVIYFPYADAAASASAAATPSSTGKEEQDDDELNAILRSLPADVAEYIQFLAESITKKYATPDFSFEDWNAVLNVIRFVAFGKLHQQQRAPDRRLEVAKALCTQFSTPDNATTVMVYDLTATTMAERFLAQNTANLEFFGHTVNNPNHMMWQTNELYAIMVCACAAIYEPGKRFCVLHAFENESFTQVACFEMVYVLDPASLLLVVSGRRVLHQE